MTHGHIIIFGYGFFFIFIIYLILSIIFIINADYFSYYLILQTRGYYYDILFKTFLNAIFN